MAVYTRVPDSELASFVSGYDIGDVVACEPIAQGIENSNYLLRTGAGKFILTIYEARVRADDLPFYLGLMAHLADRGLPCPVPVRDRADDTLRRLAGKPAAIVTFLDGDWPCDPSPAHCRELGRAMARLHEAGGSFGQSRRNDLSVDAWRPIYAPLATRSRELLPEFDIWIETELAALEEAWPRDLPTGIVHADLFPDNVFFVDGKLSGIIDFYFACTDFLAYDLAVALNAWCFGDGGWDMARAGAMAAGYQEVRRLDPAEASALPVLACGAAMRFLLTRLHDWFRPDDDSLTRRKDPRDFVPVIEFHRGISDSRDYGIECAA